MGDHTESIQIDYDPSVISYSQLLEVFWKSHCPTRVAWGGKQYMTAVWYADEEQKKAALSSLETLQKQHKETIHTKILPLTSWTNAEDYHQKYYLRHKKELLSLLGLKKDEAIMNSPIAAKLNGYVDGKGTLEGFRKALETWDLDSSTKQIIAETIEKKLK